MSELSLESRLGRLRRQRRRSFLKQALAVVGPVLVGISPVLVLAGFGIFASAR